MVQWLGLGVAWLKKKKKNSGKLTDIENKLMVTKGETCGEGLNWEIGINIYTLLYIK